MAQEYWIKVTTAKPSYTYYFGSFLTRKEAKLAQSGFLEDLETENAKGIKAKIGRYQPQELTVGDELNDNSDFALVQQQINMA